jgi:hypothetical protein
VSTLRVTVSHTGVMTQWEAVPTAAIPTKAVVPLRILLASCLLRTMKPQKPTVNRDECSHDIVGPGGTGARIQRVGGCLALSLT